LRAYVATPTSEHLARFQTAVANAREALLNLSRTGPGGALDEGIRQAVEDYLERSKTAIAQGAEGTFDREAELSLRASREAALNRVRVLSIAETRARKSAGGDCSRTREG